MCHDDVVCKIILENLSKYTKEIYINLNDPTPEVEEIVIKNPNVVKIIRTHNEGRWNQGVQREATIRMLDEVKPDIVLFPDSDETYPPSTWKDLGDFWNNEKALTLWWKLLYLWGDINHFRNDGLYKRIHHVRAYKWISGITYLPKYAGYACPTNFIDLPRETRFHATEPTLHHGYMKANDRTRKFARANCDYCSEEYRNSIDKNMLILEVPDDLKFNS